MENAFGEVSRADFERFYVMSNLKVIEYNPVTMDLNFSND